MAHKALAMVRVTNNKHQMAFPTLTNSNTRKKARFDLTAARERRARAVSGANHWGYFGQIPVFMAAYGAVIYGGL